MSVPIQQGSLRRRLLALLLIGAAMLAVVVYFLVQSVARQVARESQDNVLTASALSILDSARLSSGMVNVDLPYSALSMLDSVTDERVFYAIKLGNVFLSGYEDLPLAEPRGFNTPAHLSSQYLGEEVRVVTIRRAVTAEAGQSFLQVSVAQTLSGQSELLARMSRTSMGIGGGVFALAGVMAMLIARSTVRPLNRLTNSVSRRGPRDLRPVAAPVPAEMVPLVASLNNFMNRLQNSLTRSEEFIAEAAHRLRTPLAIVRTKAEIVERKAKDAETRAAMREMIHAVDDSSRTAGQLLDHAMVTFRLDSLVDEEVDLHQLARETVERLRPLSDMKDIELTMARSDPAILRGDPILLQNALHNIIDNAIKYAQPGTAITVETADLDEGIRLRVHDTGAGFPTTDLDRLAERFARGANAQGVVGSGLGLTIVRDVAEAHGGEMEISNDPGGGACVTLFFPLS